ncbi:MAG: hypothetical protein KBD01_17280, partial [Acidobacteria bacterium]|nr:hypothetical protein [Acidobacteriota bacterium]
LLLSADAVFAALHLVHAYTPYLPSEYFSLGRDLGYGETFQYVEEFWIIVMLGSLLARTRRAVYGAWGLLFVYLLLDDSLMFHETFGQAFAGLFGFGPLLGLRAKDLGEVAVSATAAALLGLVVGAAYFRGSRDDRSLARQLALFVGLAAFFGVVFDMVNFVLARDSIAWHLSHLDIFEEGGEMVSMTLACAFVYERHERRPARAVVEADLLPASGAPAGDPAPVAAAVLAPRAG